MAYRKHLLPLPPAEVLGTCRTQSVERAHDLMPDLSERCNGVELMTEVL